MWWKIYFYLSLIFTVIGLVLIGQKNMTIGLTLIIGISILDILGLYSFAFKKKLFSPDIWTAFFFLTVIVAMWDLAKSILGLNIPSFMGLLGLQIPESDFSSGAEIIGALITYAIQAPSLYAFYRISSLSKKKF